MAESVVAELRADIQQFRSEMRQAVLAVQQLNTQGTPAVNRLNRSTQSLGASFTQLKGILVSIGLTRLAREAIEVTTAFNAANRAMVTATGSARAGAEAMAFVRDESRRLGTDLLGGARAFATFTNSARGSALEGEGVRQVYSAMSEATVALGRSNEEFNRVMIATGQIMTKGRIQTEELLQLTEAGIPIYTELKDALKLTGEQLSDALRQGLIPAEALLAVSERLRDRFFFDLAAASGTLEVQFRALRSEFTEVLAQIGAAVFSSDELKRVIGEAREAIRQFSSSIDATAIRAWTDEIVRLVGHLLNIPNVLNLVAGQISAFFTNTAAAIRERGGIFSGFAAKEVEALGRAFDAIADTVRDTFTEGGFGNVGETLTQFNDDMDDLIRRMKSDQGLPSVAVSLADAFMGESDEYIAQISGAVEQGGKEGGEKGAQHTVQSIEDIINEIRERIAKGIGEGGKKGAEAAARAIDDIVFNRRTVFATTSQIADEFAKQVEAIQEEVQTRVGDIVFNREAIFATIPAILDDLERPLAEAQRRVNARVEEIVFNRDTMFATIDEISDELGDIVNKARQRIADRVEEIVFNREDFFATLPQALDELTKITNVKVQEETARIANAQRNLVDNMGDNLARLGERIFEEDWLGSVNAFVNLAGDAFQDLGDVLTEQGKTTTGEFLKAVGQAFQGVQTGITVAQFARQAGANRELAGGLGGAAGGAQIAGQFSGNNPYAVAAGAIIGAIVGAIGGALSRGEPGTFSRGIITQQATPDIARASDQTFRRTPFGAVFFDENGARGIGAFRDLDILVKTDAAIASLLNEQQRLLAAGALEGTISGEIKADEAEQFANQAGPILGERIATVIQAVLGGAEGAAVSARFREINPRGTPEELAQTADQIFSIIQVITQSLDPKELTPAEEAVKGIREQFAQLIPIALDYGFTLETLTAAQEAQIGRLRDQINEQNRTALLQLRDPGQANIERIQQENVDRMRETAAVGGDLAVAQELNIELIKQAHEARAEQLRAEREEARRAAAQRRREVLEFRSALAEMTNPFEAVMIRVSADLQRFREMAAEGIISPSAFQRLARLAQASARIEQSLAQATGGAATPVEQLGDVFQQFIRAGSPQNQFIDQLRELGDNFMNLSRAARTMGLSTNRLEQSFVRQARFIRQQFIQDIEAQQQAQIEGIRSVREFLRREQLDESLPLNFRFTAARAQLTAALQGQDSGVAIQAAEAFKSIARERFASSEPFFQVSRSVDAQLKAFADREQKRVEVERDRQLRVFDAQLKTLAAQQNSLAVLRAMGATQRGASQGINELIGHARQNGQQNAQVEALLRRVLQRLEVAVR